MDRPARRYGSKSHNVVPVLADPVGGLEVPCSPIGHQRIQVRRGPGAAAVGGDIGQTVGLAHHCAVGADAKRAICCRITGDQRRQNVLRIAGPVPYCGKGLPQAAIASDRGGIRTGPCHQIRTRTNPAENAYGRVRIIDAVHDSRGVVGEHGLQRSTVVRIERVVFWVGRNSLAVADHPPHIVDGIGVGNATVGVSGLRCSGTIVEERFVPKAARNLAGGIDAEPITRVKAAEGPRQAFQEGHIRRPTSRAAGVDEAVAVGGALSVAGHRPAVVNAYPINNRACGPAGSRVRKGGNVDHRIRPAAGRRGEEGGGRSSRSRPPSPSPSRCR